MLPSAWALARAVSRRAAGRYESAFDSLCSGSSDATAQAAVAAATAATSSDLQIVAPPSSAATTHASPQQLQVRGFAEYARQQQQQQRDQRDRRGGGDPRPPSYRGGGGGGASRSSNGGGDSSRPPYRSGGGGGGGGGYARSGGGGGGNRGAPWRNGNGGGNNNNRQAQWRGRGGQNNNNGGWRSSEATASKGSLLNEVAHADSLEALEAVIVSQAAWFDQDTVAVAIARLVGLVGKDVAGGDVINPSSSSSSSAAPSQQQQQQQQQQASATAAAAAAAPDDQAAAAAAPAPAPARLDALSRAQRLLAGLCGALLRFPDAITARQLCAGLRGVAALKPPGHGELVARLFEPLAADDGRLLREANPIELTLIAFSLAKLDRLNYDQQRRTASAARMAGAAPPPPDADGGGAGGSGAVLQRAWPLVARALAPHVPKMPAEQISSVLWAYSWAKGDVCSQTLRDLAPRALELLPAMAPRDLVHVAFAYSRLDATARRALLEPLNQQWRVTNGEAGNSGSSGSSETDAAAGASRTEQDARADLALARSMLEALVGPIKRALPAHKPWQLGAILSSLRQGGLASPDLLEAALPHVQRAAAEFANHSMPTPTGWLGAWKHLEQLASGYSWRPGAGGGSALARAAAEGAADDDAAGDDDADDDGAYDDGLSDAGLGDGQHAASAAGAQQAAVQREALLAVLDAAERLLARATARIDMYVASQPASASAAPAASSAAPTSDDDATTPLPPHLRRLLPVVRVARILQVASVVAPDAGEAFARTVGRHLVSRLLAQSLTFRQASKLFLLLPQAGLAGANELDGRLWPEMIDAFVAQLPGADGGAADPAAQRDRARRLAWLAQSAARLDPPPRQLLARLAPQLAAGAPHLLGSTTAQVAAAFANTAAAAGGGGASGQQQQQQQQHNTAPAHWAWDAAQPSPPMFNSGFENSSTTGSTASSSGSGSGEEDFAALADALAARIAETGPAFMLMQPPGEVAFPDPAAAAQQRQCRRHDAFARLLGNLAALGARDPAPLVSLLGQALHEGGGFGDAAPGEAARAASALVSVCARGSSSSGSDAAAAVVSALAARVAAGCGELDAASLAALRDGLPALERLAGPDAVAALRAAVDSAQ